MKLRISTAALTLAIALPAFAEAELVQFKAGEKAVAADVNANFSAVSTTAETAKLTAETATLIAETAKALADDVSASLSVVSATTESVKAMVADATETNSAVELALDDVTSAVGFNSTAISNNDSKIIQNVNRIDAIVAASQPRVKVYDANDVEFGTIVKGNTDGTYTIVLKSNGLVVSSTLEAYNVSDRAPLAGDSPVRVNIHPTLLNVRQTTVYFAEEGCKGTAYVAPDRLSQNIIDNFYRMSPISAEHIYGEGVLAFHVEGYDGNQSNPAIYMTNKNYVSNVSFSSYRTPNSTCTDNASTLGNNYLMVEEVSSDTGIVKRSVSLEAGGSVQFIEIDHATHPSPFKFVTE
ncbi:hypothetical protein RGQ13_08140 [Thalassotalea psychrophila]|uniref:Uncharacterized protein n=1 Tax=Thalassotalea psychrophila TaxID=3065647 RepID=A0ABY9TYM1_9GAMM|nr:hypothetical protein RGQ13_08140 [Colwelliaceae bacterium SQ149]